MNEEAVTELAKRICAAMLSYQIGVGMDYCYSRYLGSGVDLGGLWYDIAEHALNAQRRAMGGRRFPDDQGQADREELSGPWPTRS